MKLIVLNTDSRKVFKGGFKIQVSMLKSYKKKKNLSNLKLN